MELSKARMRPRGDKNDLHSFFERVSLSLAGIGGNNRSTNRFYQAVIVSER